MFINDISIKFARKIGSKNKVKRTYKNSIAPFVPAALVGGALIGEEHLNPNSLTRKLLRKKF